MGYPKEILQAFGAEYAEIKFEKPCSVVIDTDSPNGPETIENVYSIGVLQHPANTSIEINYTTGGGTGSIATAIQNYKEIKVLNQ